MGKLLFLIIVSVMLTGCIAVPVYDDGYYSHYGPRSYGYVAPEISIFVPFYHGGHGYRGNHGFYGGHGGRGSRGGRR